MFKNKIMCYVMNISFSIPFDNIRFLIYNYNEWVDVFNEVSDFCLENHVLC